MSKTKMKTFSKPPMYNHRRFNNTCNAAQAKYLNVLLVINTRYRRHERQRAWIRLISDYKPHTTDVNSSPHTNTQFLDNDDQG